MTIIFFRNESFFFPLFFGIIFFHLVILYIGVTRLRWNYFLDSIHTGSKEGLVLTFDDSPNPEFTSKVLAVLKKHEAKATFFVIGKNIEGNEDVLKRIDQEGHLIGNHSFSHSYWFNVLRATKIIADIDKANILIENTIGKKPVFFRIPFGLSSPNIEKALKKTVYHSIGWDFRSFDTMAKRSDKLLQKLKNNAKSSSIMLLHDNNKFTLEVLDGFLTYCSENGIKIVSLEEKIGLKAYAH